MIRIRRIRIHTTGPDNACYVTYELQLCVATLSDSPIRILDLVSELLLLLSTRFPLHQGEVRTGQHVKEPLSQKVTGKIKH